MATVERVGPSHIHTRVATLAPKATLPGERAASITIIHHQSTKAGVGFYASRQPEPG
jgi:hypothetical protein